jgi:uncharacterized membrane protein
MEHEPIPSKAAVKGHPLHPVMIPFPIAFGVAVVFTDIAYWVDDSRAWAVASAWLLWAAFATGVIAAVLGAIDYFGSTGCGRTGWPPSTAPATRLRWSSSS